MALLGAHLLILLAIFALVHVTVAKPKWQSRIIKGRNVRKDQLPYMVGIIQKHNTYLPMSLCGGAIINNRVILTSASCIEDFTNELDKLIAILGSPSPSSTNSFRIKIDAVKIHPKYNSKTQAFDLALIRTSDEIVFSSLIQPIALPTSDLRDEVNATASGWGLLEVRLNIFISLKCQPYAYRHKL